MAEALHSEITAKLQKLTSNMEIGERLPSERKLAADLGVSRNVLRESLKIMEEKGTVDIQPGRGIFIVDKKDAKLADQLGSILGDKYSIQDIMEVRASLEISVFEKAAIRATDDDIEDLKNIYDELNGWRDNPIRFSDCDKRFHLRLARATHNSLYEVLIKTFYETNYVKAFSLTELYPEAIGDAQIEHKEIIDAIRTRNPIQAREVGNKHFDVTKYISSQK